MAIVPNKDGQGIKANYDKRGYGDESYTYGDFDRGYTTPTVFGTVIPFVGTVPPQHASQIYLNTATGIKYRCLSYWDQAWAEVK